MLPPSAARLDVPRDPPQQRPLQFCGGLEAVLGEQHDILGFLPPPGLLHQPGSPEVGRGVEPDLPVLGAHLLGEENAGLVRVRVLHPLAPQGSPRQEASQELWRNFHPVGPLVRHLSLRGVARGRRGGPGRGLHEAGRRRGGFRFRNDAEPGELLHGPLADAAPDGDAEELEESQGHHAEAEDRDPGGWILFGRPQGSRHHA
mmetsp:Transcript_8448/g.24147  ORF Transcript_8448/g.24147 Transcript_8448/m.24147 type:complete len:202 (+) Transcript_8448:645-1250(+)